MRAIWSWIKNLFCKQPQTSRRDAIQNLLDELEEYDGEMMLADGLESAIIGIGNRCSKEPIMAYSAPRIIDILMQRNGMTYEHERESPRTLVVG